jgi:hypothetical protein
VPVRRTCRLSRFGRRRERLNSRPCGEAKGSLRQVATTPACPAIAAIGTARIDAATQNPCKGTGGYAGAERTTLGVPLNARRRGRST